LARQQEFLRDNVSLHYFLMWNGALRHTGFFSPAHINTMISMVNGVEQVAQE
jgi:uncharacterized Zn finger protein